MLTQHLPFQAVFWKAGLCQDGAVALSPCEQSRCKACRMGSGCGEEQGSRGLWLVCRWLSCDWREKPPGKGFEATGGRMGRAEEQAWKGREHLCQFCFLAPHFTRDADRLVRVQQEEQGAQGKAAGAWEPER